jgi:hypothetical protein
VQPENENLKTFQKTTKIFSSANLTRCTITRHGETCENAGFVACLTSFEINAAKNSNIASHTDSPSDESSGWKIPRITDRRRRQTNAERNKAVEFNSLSRALFLPAHSTKLNYCLKKTAQRSLAGSGVEHKDKIRE